MHWAGVKLCQTCRLVSISTLFVQLGCWETPLCHQAWLYLLCSCNPAVVDLTYAYMAFLGAEKHNIYYHCTNTVKGLQLDIRISKRIEFNQLMGTFDPFKLMQGTNGSLLGVLTHLSCSALATIFFSNLHIIQKRKQKQKNVFFAKCHDGRD